MRAMSCLLPLGLVLTLSACEDSADSLADARELLLLSAISGEEDSLAGDLSASSRADDAGPEADRAAPPPMFRECDAEGEFVGLFEAYDADASGALDGEEPSEVEADHGGRPGGPRDGLRHLIGFVYDLDQSHSLEDSELAVIFEDFTARCGAIQASLLVEFDADGDGALSEAEQETARAAHEARMEAERAEMEACRCDGERPEHAEEGGRGEGPPPRGEGRGEDSGEGRGEPPFGPLEQAYDVDGDGALSEAERSAAREALRAALRAGERPGPELACEDAG